MSSLSNHEQLSRGQIVVVGALLIGTILVGIALVVNGAIYSENLASQQTTSTKEVVDTRTEIWTTVNASLGDANQDETVNDSHEALASDLPPRITRDTRHVTDGAAERGTIASVSVSNITNRTIVTHDDDEAAFTDATGEANWTVASSVIRLENTRMDVNTSSLQPAGAADAFTLAIDNGSTWSMTVTDPPTGGGVQVETSGYDGTTSTCTASGDRVWINITAGTLDGTDCPGLAASHPDDPATVTYQYGDTVKGTYHVSAVMTAPADTDRFDTTGAPSATYAVESATITYRYQSTRIQYTATIPARPRVAT